MKNLSEEMLNKYIDNELSSEENNIISKILKNSVVDRTRYSELKKIDRALKNIHSAKTSINFTTDFMEKLRIRTLRNKKQSRFIIFVSSILITLILGFTGTAMFDVISKSFKQFNKISLFKNLSFKTDFITQNMGSLFSPDRISLIGISLSFVIIISLYFLLEEIKKTKNRLSKIR